MPMRWLRPTPTGTSGLLALLMLLCAGLAAAADAGVEVRVFFTPDRGCAVTAEGEAFHANLIYPAPANQPATLLRCAVPGTPKGRDVRLVVALPHGVAPGGDSFPMLDWRQAADGSWQGEAHLPASPAFVRVPLANHQAAGRSRWLDLITLAAAALGVSATLVYGRRA